MSSTEPPAGSVPPDPNLPPASTPPPPPPAGGPAPSSYGAPPPAPAPAGPGQAGSLLDRFVARLVDFIVIGIVAFIIRAILAAISDGYVLSTLIGSIITTVLYLAYFGYLESSRGQTLGKQIMKLKVFGPDGHSLPTMQEAIKRNIWLAASVLAIFGAIGSAVGGLIEIVAIIVCAVNINSNVPDRRTWFDNFASGTQVVKVG